MGDKNGEQTLQNPDETQKNTPNPSKPFDVNHYATHKTMAGGLLNIGLLTSNASQLKIIVGEDLEQNPIYYATLTLIVISILMLVN